MRELFARIVGGIVAITTTALGRGRSPTVRAQDSLAGTQPTTSSKASSSRVPRSLLPVSSVISAGTVVAGESSITLGTDPGDQGKSAPSLSEFQRLKSNALKRSRRLPKTVVSCRRCGGVLELSDTRWGLLVVCWECEIGAAAPYVVQRYLEDLANADAVQANHDGR